MKLTLSSKVLDLQTKESKKTGKPYTIAKIFLFDSYEVGSFFVPPYLLGKIEPENDYKLVFTLDISNFDMSLKLKDIEK